MSPEVAEIYARAAIVVALIFAAAWVAVRSLETDQ